MQNKTVAEVNALAEQLAATTYQSLQRAQAYQPPAQQPQPQQPAFDPDDVVTGRILQQQGQQFVQQAGQAAYQAVNPAIEMAASTNLEMVKGQFPQEFGKYGPEVYGRLQNLPKDRWTIDNLKTVVKLVQTDHLDELVSERASRLAAENPALRSSGANGTQLPPDTASPEAQLTDAQKATLRRHGLTPQIVAEQSAKMGWTQQKWYEMFGKHSIGEGG